MQNVLHVAVVQGHVCVSLKIVRPEKDSAEILSAMRQQAAAPLTHADVC